MKKFTETILEDNNTDDDLSRLVARIIGDCKMDYDQIQEHAPEVIEGIKEMILEWHKENWGTNR